MNRDEVVKKLKEYSESRINLVIKKSKDYAKDSDAFSNFKMIADICDIQEKKVFLIFIAVKIARLSNLLSSGLEPQNESITDTLMDLSNYAELLRAYLDEEENEKKEN